MQEARRGSEGTVLLDDGSGERFGAPTRFAGYALHDPLGREVGRVESLVGLRVTEANITVSNVYFPEQERQQQIEERRREQEAQERQRVQ